MALPLQPDLDRPVGSWRRWGWPLIALILILLLGAWQQQRRRPDRLLVNDGSVHQRYLPQVSSLLQEARQRILVMVYVMRLGENADDPVRHLCSLLTDAAQRGIAVTVVLDRSDPDATWPGPDNGPAADLLRAGGVQVVLDELDRCTHAKIILVDHLAIIGSHNWTRSALIHNRECSVLSGDADVLTACEALFASVPDPE